MKNKLVLTAILTLALVLVMTVIGCDTDGGGGGNPPGTYTGYDREGNEYRLEITNDTGRSSRAADSALNGTWVNSTGRTETTYNNGNWEATMDGYLMDKGTIATSGSAFTITYTHIHGAYFNHSLNYSLQSKWYTKAEFKATSDGSKFTDVQLDEIFQSHTGTYSISGDTLTMSGTALGNPYTTTWTRKGTNPGTGGDNSGNKNYSLTIKDSGGTTVGTSNGTIATISVDGNTYTLSHADGTFTVKINGRVIAQIPDTIYLDGGRTRDGPGTLNETRPKPNNSNPGVGGVVWPDSGILAEYSLSGLPAPASALTSNWSIETSSGHPRLAISFNGSSANDSAITGCFTSNDWTLDDTITNTYGTYYYYSKAGFEQSNYMRQTISSQTQCMIFSYKSNSETIWPYARYLAEYGLSGLSAPADAEDIRWGVMANNGTVFNIDFEVSSANDSAINSCFTSNGWNLTATVDLVGTIMCTFTKTGFDLGSYTRNKDGGNYTILIKK